MLKEQIDADLIVALKAKNLLAADTLRGLKTRIKNSEVTAMKDLDDEAVQSLAASEIKRRREAIEAFAAAGRTESAAKEAQEIQVLQGYLPPQLSEAEVAEIVDRELQGKNFGAADFGKAMGAVMPALKGKAEGNLISKILKEKLK